MSFYSRYNKNDFLLKLISSLRVTLQVRLRSLLFKHVLLRITARHREFTSIISITFAVTTSVRQQQKRTIQTITQCSTICSKTVAI